VIPFTGYGVIAEKSRVGQLGRIFPCTLSKEYQKMNHLSTCSITVRSLGKIAQRAPALMWCLFLFFFTGTIAAKRQTAADLPVLNLLTSQKSGFSPRIATRSTDSSQTRQG